MNQDCDHASVQPRSDHRPPPLRHGRRWLPWAGACCLGAAGLALVDVRELAAQRTGRPMDDAGALWVSDSALDDSRRLLLVVDPGSRHAAVYHVDTATGALVLRSTRNLSWDLMVDDFNAQEPRPAALKRMLQTGPAPTSEPAPPPR
ncbi:MAG: hypothetical protein K8S94_02310 [Planctomycetia bacterium]|nr:hypothetical protein [Planctomycetia bacterium]